MEQINKIRVVHKNEYVIEVNDKGETITFNLDDPELMLKMDNTLHEINKIQERAKLKQSIIEKHEDKATPGLLSSKEREVIELTVSMFKDMRKAMDQFLGEGACQKIFGDVNYPQMYDDLFEQLGPHFEKMKLNIDTFKKEIVNKYSDEDEEVLM